MSKPGVRRVRSTISAQLTHGLIGTYRGWGAYEKSNGGPDIIDFDIIEDKTSFVFKSRLSVLHALNDLDDHLRRCDTTPEAEFLRMRVRGSIYYLRALMGEQMPFDRYLNAILGIVPSKFSEDEIARARQKLVELSNEFGFRFHAEDRKKMERLFLVRDVKDRKKGLLCGKKLWLARLRKAGIPVPKTVDFKVRVSEVDDYWTCWTKSGADGTFEFLINVHPRKKSLRGQLFDLSLHEILGHIVQFSIWREQIRCGGMNPACGLTVVHAPEALVHEALALSVADFLADTHNLPSDFWWYRSFWTYKRMILHNAHLMLYEGVPIEKVLSYAGAADPFEETPQQTECELQYRGTRVLNRAYQLAYVAGYKLVGNLTACMSQEQRRRFFHEMYCRPLTPGQLSELAMSIQGGNPDYS